MPSTPSTCKKNKKEKKRKEKEKSQKTIIYVICMEITGIIEVCSLLWGCIQVQCFVIASFVLNLQSQHDELEAKFFEERAALEAKYQKLYEPLYTKV